MLLYLWLVQKKGVNWKPGLLVYFVKCAKQVIWLVQYKSLDVEIFFLIYNL